MVGLLRNVGFGSRWGSVTGRELQAWNPWNLTVQFGVWRSETCYLSSSSSRGPDSEGVRALSPPSLAPPGFRKAGLTHLALFKTLRELHPP